MAKTSSAAAKPAAKQPPLLKAGDKVAWQSSGGKSVGTVVKKLSSPTHIKSHKVAASPEHPQLIVKSDKSGKLAAHKPKALKKHPAP